MTLGLITTWTFWGPVKLEAYETCDTTEWKESLHFRGLKSDQERIKGTLDPLMAWLWVLEEKRYGLCLASWKNYLKQME